MKKGYIAYLVVATVLCVAGLIGINKLVAAANAKIAAIGEPTVQAATPALPAEQLERLNALPHASQAPAPAAKPAEKPAEPPKQEAKAEPPKPAPKPAEPARYYTPSGRTPPGRVFSDEDLKPDTSKPHVIVDFSPAAAAGLDWQAAVASKRCAAFSFRPDPKSATRVNRLYCDPVVAKN